MIVIVEPANRTYPISAKPLLSALSTAVSDAAFFPRTRAGPRR